MNFKVTVPDNFFAERQYIADVLLKEFLGLDYDIEQVADAKTVKISNNENAREITFPDVFFSMDESDWLKEKSLPKEPLKMMNRSLFPGNPILSSDQIPVIYGTNESKVSVSEEEIFIPVDVFGSAFFMLTRYEEAVKNDLDTHDRFPAGASLAFRANFLNRPVINEYLEILWSCLKTLWPVVRRKERKFEMVLSHDVDAPFKYVFMSLYRFGRLVLADLFKRRSPSLAVKNILKYFAVKLGNVEKDPFNSFDLIMDISESFNLKSIFFFIAERTDKKHDGFYDIENRRIIELIKKIDGRGHKIGLHGSYNSYCSQQVVSEFIKLKQVCVSAGIKQDINTSRQHFLRWSTPETFQYLEDAGIIYDTTLTYAEHPGFRTGVCYPYPVFNVKTRKPLGLVEIPLVIMEASLIAQRYMNLDHKDALKLAFQLKTECAKYEGTFTILWHNHEFDLKEKHTLYLNILNG